MHFGGQDATNISYFLQFFWNIGLLAFSDSFPIQAENLIKHETHIMSLSSILPMEMAVANVSNIMERVISRSSFKK